MEFRVSPWILSAGASMSNSRVVTHGKSMAICVGAKTALPVTVSLRLLPSPERNGGQWSKRSAISVGSVGRHRTMDDFRMTGAVFPDREGRTATRGGAAVVASLICCSFPRSGCPAVRGPGLAPRFRSGGRSSSFDGRPIAPEKKRERGIVASAVNVLVENAPLMELSGGQTQFVHRLPSGLGMEVIVQRGLGPDGGGRTESSRAPLLFVHGSYHGAWCWACFWMPYFSARGHDCYAISLLGQGASDLPAGKVSFSLQSHAEDIAHFVKHNLTEPPVLIGHSFGGLIVQLFFSPTTGGREEPLPSIAAAALVCSSPPSGNGPMVKRFLKRDLFSCLQITLSLAAKMFGSSLSLCRKSFFSADMPDADVQRYQQVLKQSSRCAMIDFQKFNEVLPLPRLPTRAPPVLVLGAENDFIVDQEGTQETASWYGTEPVVISDSAHDLMLDTRWKKAAEALEDWLNGLSL